MQLLYIRKHGSAIVNYRDFTTRLDENLTSALSGGQHAPRSGNLMLHVRDEQNVSQLRPTPTEKRPDFVWTAPTNRYPTLANIDGQG